MLSVYPPQRCCRRPRAGSWHTSDYFSLTVAHRARIFQTMIFWSCERVLRLPRKPLSNWEMSSGPPNVRVWPQTARPSSECLVSVRPGSEADQPETARSRIWPATATGERLHSQ
jgi:hypothetical protein